MCGIAGMVGGPDPDLLNRMMEAIRHRGPDDEGRHIDGLAALGHRRLSIIDVAGGRQPIASEDGRYWIIFNGEIYNYLELRDELKAKGHRFKTQSDTETILHLYEEVGEACPERLRGMFAFAVWDSADHTLFIARDRLGIKPLFYAQTAERFSFASELKALLADKTVNRELDAQALDQYLTFMYVPAPATILRSVRKLPPGHWLRLKNGTLTIRRYWDLPPAEASGTDNRSEAEVCEELADLFRNAVRVRLMSEVPLGAYLSGGLDSSLVAAMMSAESESAVHTFSVGFEERRFDERPHAQRVAEFLGTAHRELVARHDAFDELPKMVRHLDEPVADSAAIPTYLMAELTKRHVTVVLTGEGADELFAGYSHYKILRAGNAMRGLAPSCPARWAAALLGPFITLRRMAQYAACLRDPAAAYLRLTRSAMLSILDSEYIKLARAKGVNSRIVIWKHALRNSLIPPLTVSALVLAGLITHAVVVETVFAWPGIGRMAYEAVSNGDFPVITGSVLCFVSLYIGVNFVTDMLYAVVDPRIRYDE